MKTRIETFETVSCFLLTCFVLASQGFLVSAFSECELAESIGRPPFTQESVNLAPADRSFFNGACHVKPNSHTMWYKFTSYFDGVFQATVYDQSAPTTLSVFTSGTSSCSNLECLEYFGEYKFIDLYVEFPAIDEEDYYIAITSDEGATWKLDFEVQDSIRLRNDHCTRSYDIGFRMKPNFESTISTFGAFPSEFENEACGVSDEFRGLWYEYTPNRDRLLTATLEDNVFNARISVFRGNSCDDEMRCQTTSVFVRNNSGGINTGAVWIGAQGVTYTILISGANDFKDAGSARFSVTASPVPDDRAITDAPTLTRTPIPTVSEIIESFGPTISPAFINSETSSSPSASDTVEVASNSPTIPSTPAPTPPPRVSPGAPLSTASPTIVSSAGPTASISSTPSTRSPSEYPSRRPSVSPSETFSGTPSSKPSPVPSPGPSVAPSLALSLQPSQLPSTMLTILPSMDPSIAPSLVPTDSPSSGPSRSPSFVPSHSPSDGVSLSPTEMVSSSPSPGLTTVNFVGLSQTLQGISEMTEDDIESWERAAIIHSNLYWNSNSFSRDVDDFETEIEVVNVLVYDNLSGQRRRLQASSNSIRIDYTQTITYRPMVPTVDAEGLATGPFNSPTANEEFAASLRGFGGNLASITSVEDVTILDGLSADDTLDQSPGTVSSLDDSSSNKRSLWELTFAQLATTSVCTVVLLLSDLL